MKYTNEALEKIAKNAITNWGMSQSHKEVTAKKILNIKYLDNEQWLYYSRRTSTFEDLIPNENTPRVTANMFVPYVESVKSKILSMNPTPLVVSLTRDWSDVMLALNFQKMFVGILNNIDFEDKMQDLVDAMLVCSGVYLLPYWNEDINDIDVEVLSDIMAYTDPIAKSFKNARYSCFFEAKSTMWINETYGKNYQADMLEKVMDGWYLKVFTELKGVGERKYGEKVFKNVDINDCTIVAKVFFKEDGKYKVAKVANLFKKPEVLEVEELMADMIYIPYYRNYFSQQGRTPLEGLRGMQRDINQMLTRLKYDYSKREKMLVDELSIELSQDMDTFDMSGDEVIRFTSKIPGQLPVQWNPAPPKAMDWNIWMRMWGEAGGQAEASRGNTPTSQASGLLTEMLIEQDETKIGNAKSNLRIGLGKLFKEMMKIIVAKYDEDRVVAYMGRERGWQAVSYQMFKNKDLKFDIVVRIGEALPTSPISRLNMVMKFAQFGLYNDMENPYEKLRELANLETYEFDVIDQHTDKQNAEIEMIIKAEVDPPGVAPWDDHLKHIKVLVAFLNTRDFEMLDRGKQQEILAHLGQHNVIVQSQVPPMQADQLKQQEQQQQKQQQQQQKQAPQQGQGIV